jgi:hypothetical protein
VAAVEALLAAFQAVRSGRRGDHAADPKPARLGTPAQERARRRRRDDCEGTHGGRGT